MIRLISSVTSIFKKHEPIKKQLKEVMKTSAEEFSLDIEENDKILLVNDVHDLYLFSNSGAKNERQTNDSSPSNRNIRRVQA